MPSLPPSMFTHLPPGRPTSPLTRRTRLWCSFPKTSLLWATFKSEGARSQSWLTLRFVWWAHGSLLSLLLLVPFEEPRLPCAQVRGPYGVRLHQARHHRDRGRENEHSGQKGGVRACVHPPSVLLSPATLRRCARWCFRHLYCICTTRVSRASLWRLQTRA